MRKLFGFLLVVLMVCLNPLTTNSSTPEKESMVKISTEFGDMIVKLYNDTPIHRDNFLEKVKEGFYNGTLFHRTIPFFMAQGGDPFSKNATSEQALGRDNCNQIPAEILPHHFHKKGVLSAARLPDGSNPDRKSSACQFFVVQGYPMNDQQLANYPDMTPKRKAWYKARGGAPYLDNQYTVFGEVVEGLEVIDLIIAVPTSTEGATKERPLEDVAMTMELM